MSEWIEVDGKKYFEQSYLQIGNETAKRRGEEVERLKAELAAAKEELSLVKCGEPNHPDRAYAVKNWLKTFGHKVYCNLKHGEVGFVLSLLQEGEISRGKAAEAIAELLVGNEPLLPVLQSNTFGDDEFPAETVARLRADLAATQEQNTALAEQLETEKYEAYQHANMRELAEQQRDALAAALERYKAAIEHFGPDKVQLDDDTMYHSQDCTCDRCEDKAVMESLVEDHSAILAARDADQRRKGAVWALKQTISHVASNYERERFEAMLVAIERGEVEVPSND